ncbi:PAS/PAC sensor hybrid histidine kinase [Calycina marina]|uniref:PAS/PAC sensor hybrid histidine kinase n=1 Tax=Calycina marina TaxID=1763456 RepID=A0A9P7YVG5_9HELO|nr:PAS/PAC sensor hybrid histidine kinase [Calycina marina]
MQVLEPRQVERSYNYFYIGLGFVVAFLGTFTATQLMIQARLSARFSIVLTWLLLISLAFGFCASWSLHFVGMLACTLDVPITLDLGLTIFTGVLAVFFTFVTVGWDILRVSYKGPHGHKREHVAIQPVAHDDMDTRPLLERGDYSGGPLVERLESEPYSYSQLRDIHEGSPNNAASNYRELVSASVVPLVLNEWGAYMTDDNAERGVHSSSAAILFPTLNPPYQSSSQDPAMEAVYDLEGMTYQSCPPYNNAFVATYYGVLGGMSWKAVWMGLLWSLSLTCMHYGGLTAVNIPQGYLTYNPVLAVISALVSWTVCLVGYIYMRNIRAFIGQQILLSAVVASGILTMHSLGMKATTFWTTEPAAPIEERGYPVQLPVAVFTVAILTCMLANGLLAHNATLSRNKLAEIVWTRKELWKTIEQKNSAEAAAAARSAFIALASHEIRTPLHYLQGYSDLLSRTDLNDESRQLLISIQSATKTLSLITNNVLDWSKIESDRDALCRPTAIDMRGILETVIILLPNKEDGNVELMVVVAPNVPETLMLDESYLHRILMNLLSNALKFTTSGYVMLTLEMKNSDLVAIIRDTGAGIPSSFIPKMFEPFSQAETKGSQRGTGLGLSIVNQLLKKMDGTIEVTSQNAADGFDPLKTGTIFTISIPVSASELRQSQRPIDDVLAIIHPGDERKLQGLQHAWNLFGYEVLVVKTIRELFTGLIQPQIKYIWVDPSSFHNSPDCMADLLSHTGYLVLVPYENSDELQEPSGLLMGSHFVSLQKPLLWHTFKSRIESASTSGNTSSNTTPSQTLSTKSSATGGKDTTSRLIVNVLLVEDNKVNQTLGMKMLTTLGYRVMLANDGDEAIRETFKHDSLIDMILMDQSMPIKDGLTATREIRELEKMGQLTRRHPIIAITAVVDAQSKTDFKEAGADDFLSKPLGLKRLEQTLANFSKTV